MKKIFNNKKILYIVLGIVSIFVIGGAFLTGYYLAKNSVEQYQTKKDTKDALKALQDLVDKNSLVEENDTALLNSEIIDYNSNLKPEKNISKPVKSNFVFSNKPKLVIIMDDMSFNSQVKALQKLSIKITPSFFPPSKRHPNTAIYAKSFSHYMVHFPMQATSRFFQEEEKTLHIDTPYTFILNRIIYIKKNFPKVKFVNNHTGSKFTANYDAMKRLYKALKKEKIIFVDSRTTAKTKAPLLAKQNNEILLSRDVFLDNKPDISYIQKQLKYAVKVSKKKGYAIAICHPHYKTFEALNKSKDILSKVEVIYIDELYQLIKNHKLSKL